jgi:oligoendopeptidase F
LSFDGSTLPREYSRRFLPAKTDLSDVARLQGYFDQLQKRPIVSKGDLEKWLSDESELLGAVSEEQSIRYIRMTCQTDDSAREKAYLDFVERIEPEVKKRVFELDRKYLASPARKQLTPENYSVLDRRRENSASLFREANVELEKEETKLGNDYQKTTGAMTVNYDGRENTMQQMARYLEETNRAVREKTWTLAEQRRLKDRDELDDMYDRLIELRARVAKNAGFDNYRDYIFRKLARFDYTKEDCFQYHDAVEKHIVPLVREIDEDRRDTLDVDPLRPWDLVVDPEGRPPLRPFKTGTELAQGCLKVFEKTDPDFARDFRRMSDLALLDLESRKGKAPGGYNTELMEARLPFIFMNGVGRDTDLRTLLHEAGHAFHVFATRKSNMHFLYRGENIPTEFAEVASQAMEFIAGEHLEGVFYNREENFRTKREHIIDTLKLLPWVATIDAFQHWIYTHPGHCREARQEEWLKIRERFGGIENYDGFEESARSRWQRQLHLYLVPFYYIEYGIAMLGALGIWMNYRNNSKKALDKYKSALKLGGSRPLPTLFETAGVPFKFGSETVAPYARELKTILRSS